MRTLLLVICIGVFTPSFAQKKLSKLLKQQNTESIPYVFVEELNKKIKDFTLLDAREEKEYTTSHLQNAIYVGYDSFNLHKIKPKLPPKDSKIVVYCSLGIRSEDVAEKLKKAGYTNVYNLYGGIFEWKNKDFKVFDIKGNETENVHTFNKNWSKWLIKGHKIYDK